MGKNAIILKTNMVKKLLLIKQFNHMNQLEEYLWKSESNTKMHSSSNSLED